MFEKGTDNLNISGGFGLADNHRSDYRTQGGE